MSPVHLRNQSEDRKGMFRIRKIGTGHLEHCSGRQYTEGNYTHSAIHLPILQKPQKSGLEGYGSAYSAPSTPKRFIPMEHAQQEVQPSITLARTWRKLP
ncbi:hypothetical protein O181_001298 [Austropuccinia psidii MF-1]|uniref:Uncharacterized protein n=1 Tax=Austropuccinia psidii MF-1 TaxID=1389203 RepID=A0A9Q3BA87_9BASI|nr:hypothetical protein [Austropuccinia psidii MF-1]